MILQSNTASASDNDIEELDQAIDALSGNRPEPPQPVHHLQSAASRSSSEIRKVDVNRSQKRFFDVIDSRPSNINSTLRTPQKTETKQLDTTEDEEPELLPEHATLSYNEKPESTNSNIKSISSDFTDAKNDSEDNQPYINKVSQSHKSIFAPSDNISDNNSENDNSDKTDSSKPEIDKNALNFELDYEDDSDKPVLPTDSVKASVGMTGDLPKPGDMYRPKNPNISKNEIKPMETDKAKETKKPSVFHTDQYHAILPNPPKEKSGHKLIIWLLVITMLSSLASLILLIMQRS